MKLVFPTVPNGNRWRTSAVIIVNLLLCQNITAVMVRRILIPQVWRSCDFYFFWLICSVLFCGTLRGKVCNIIQHTISLTYHMPGPRLGTERYWVEFPWQGALHSVGKTNKQIVTTSQCDSCLCRVWMCTTAYGNMEGVCQNSTEGESWWWNMSWSEERLEGIQESRNTVCKDMNLIKNTCSRDLKEILCGLRPEVELVEKIIRKHMRERH